MTQRIRYPAWAAAALGCVWLGVFPLWQDGSFSRITRAKWIGMLILTAVTLLATAITAVAARIRKEKMPLRPSVPAALGFVYFLLVALSAFLGAWRHVLNSQGQLTVFFGAVRYEGLITQLCYCAIFLCMAMMRPRLDVILHASSAVLMIFTAITALQYAGVNVLGLYPAGRSIRTNYEFQGTIGNIDMVAGYVTLILPLALAAFVQQRRGGWHLFISGLCGMLLIFCMEVQCSVIALAALLGMLILLSLRHPETRPRTLLTLACAALAASIRQMLVLPWLDGGNILTLQVDGLSIPLLLVTVMLIAASLLIRQHPGKALSLRAIILLVAVLCIAASALIYLLPIPAGNGLWELREMLHGRAEDAFGSERIGIWRLTLGMSSESWPKLLLGHGPDTFLYTMDDYLTRTSQSLVQRFDNPHNMLLAILANNGLPAMLAFIALCAAAILRGLRRGMAPLALSALCYLIQGMFTFSICLVTPMFWCVMGLLIASTTPARKESTT